MKFIVKNSFFYLDIEIIYLKPFPSGQEIILLSSEFGPLLSFRYWKCLRTSILVGSLIEVIFPAFPMRKFSEFLELFLTGLGLGSATLVGWPSGRPLVDRPSFIFLRSKLWKKEKENFKCSINVIWYAQQLNAYKLQCSLNITFTAVFIHILHNWTRSLYCLCVVLPRKVLYKCSVLIDPMYSVHSDLDRFIHSWKLREKVYCMEAVDLILIPENWDSLAHLNYRKRHIFYYDY